MTQSTNIRLPWIIAAIVIILDQVTKRIVDGTMELHQSIPFIGDIVRWTYVQNRGMLFGLEWAGGRPLGVVSTFATIVFAIILIKSSREPLIIRLIIGAIIGGAVGNTIDRLAYGYVIDFCDVDLPNWLMDRWPVFNVADSAVSVGVTILVILMLFRPGLIKNPDSTVIDSEHQNDENMNNDFVVSSGTIEVKENDKMPLKEGADS